MSPPDRQTRRARLGPLVCGLLLVAITVGVRLPAIMQHHAIDDEVNYSVVARQLMDGGLLYVDVVERRPPATFWLYEGVFRLFGRENFFALHLVGTAWVLLTMLAMYIAASRLFGRRAGFAAALFYGVFQPWWYWDNLAFNGEVLMNLPVAAAYALCVGATRTREWMRLAAAGAVVVVGFLLKQPAAVAAIPLLIYLLHPARSRAVGLTIADRFRAVAWLAAGAVAVLAALGVWLVAHGIMREALYWSIFDHDVPLIYFDKAVEHTAAFVALTCPMLAAALWSLRSTDGWRRFPAERDAFLWLLVVSAIAAAASGRFYPHYYIGMLPALSILAAPAAAPLALAGPVSARRVAILGIAWIACAAIGTFVNQAIAGARQPAMTEAGLYLRQHGDAAARVFVWGRTPRIYLDSNRRPAARYIDTFPLTGRIFGPSRGPVDTSSRVQPWAWDQLREDFRAHPPAFIVDTQSLPGAEYPVALFPWLGTLLREDYSEVAKVAEGTIYSRLPKSSEKRISE